MTFNVLLCIKTYKWYVIGIIILVLAEVALVGGIGIWREYFWAAVQQRELHSFLVYVLEFSIMALGICLISGYTTYLISYISLLIRTDLTSIAITKPYHLIEGGEQRIQEDCFSYPFNAISLLVGMFRNILVLIVFIAIIIAQVGVLYLCIPVVYTVIGTLIAAYIAKPLINLNYLMQVFEAKLRRSIINTFENTFHTDYKDVLLVNKNLFVATKKLSYFQSFYNQITVIVPYLILCPLYFSGKIVFGVFMQVASSMQHVVDSLSYIINSFNQINNWLSCRKRLKELGVLYVKQK